MNSFKVVCAGLVGAWLLASCSEYRETKCSLNEDCIDGLCNAEGTCEGGALVDLVAAALDPAEVGDENYRQQLQVRDGLSPYSWTMVVDAGAGDKLSWLEIGAGSGMLRAKAGQEPTETGKGLEFSVTVRDSSNGGAGHAVTRVFSLDIVECLSNKSCYEVEGDICLQGEKDCTDGILAEECVISGPSTVFEHCGADCGACPEPATNSCVAGECKCGSRDPCGEGTACCGTGCFDLEETEEHCGACESDCNELVANAVTVRCEGGLCDYDENAGSNNGCELGYLDCDGSKANGCETTSNTNHCADCEDDCTAYPNTEGHVCEGMVCGYECELGWDDCDEYVGCETEIFTADNCSGCGDKCDPEINPAGLRCILVDVEKHQCGCEDGNDCAKDEEDRMCCEGQICVIHSPENCEDCGDQCTVLKGGLSCVGSVDTGWECQCTDTTYHTDCRGQYVFSQAECIPATNQCECEDVYCAGTVDHMCCFGAGSEKDCVDLNTDENNCGACWRDCVVGETCIDGVCSCLEDYDCPNLTGEVWRCYDDTCVCPAYLLDPCPPGQYCCGETGQNQPNGCCTKDCDTLINEGNSCSDDCGGVWCYWGCCSSDDCVDEEDCAVYEPEGFPFNVE